MFKKVETDRQAEVRGLLDSSRTVIVATASVKEDEVEAKLTLPHAYCISLPRDTML
jgi:hypothetical protein